MALFRKNYALPEAGPLRMKVVAKRGCNDNVACYAQAVCKSEKKSGAERLK